MENLWNEIRFKRPYTDRIRRKNRIEKEWGKLGWFMSKTKTATSPPREREPVGTLKVDRGLAHPTLSEN